MIDPAPDIDEALIARLVDAFYVRVPEDPMLGPIFARHVTDWSQHLPSMVAFWTKIVLHRGTYDGRPMEAHMRIPGLGPVHFDRWLTLWTATVEEVVPPTARDSLIMPAQRIATSMLAILMRTDDPD